jgi:CreA protein
MKKLGFKLFFVAVLILGAYLLFHRSSGVDRTKIGEVTTVFNPLSPNSTIQIESFVDPKIPSNACAVSRAVSGGWGSTVGLSEDKSEFSISCRQISDQVVFSGESIPQQEVIAKEKISAVFKTLSIVRFVDQKNSLVVYLVYSDKVIEGSPKNSISSVWVNKPISLK